VSNLSEANVKRASPTRLAFCAVYASLGVRKAPIPGQAHAIGWVCPGKVLPYLDLDRMRHVLEGPHDVGDESHLPVRWHQAEQISRLDIVVIVRDLFGTRSTTVSEA
jgi:hypothetical protein